MGERRGTKALELWCRRMVEGYKNVRIDNMTTSWRDGLAFCALVSKCSTLKQLPDLIHFDELKKEDIYHNNELAFRVAEEYLGIPALLDPQDMADYDIPDKLSILTYLSQYYQVFGAQENSIRLSKRSSTEANKSSASTPPAKMAHVVPKREPCVKCNNPVFFAERLVIEGHLYHRTCFRCARCDSVLTLGNFYQTETDNEFCCETCPDEELKSKRPTKVDDANRMSIAERIALFEKTETTSVLKKSLSDEEKSKSLSRQLPMSANSHALNGFLTSQINGDNDEDEAEKTNESVSSDSESDAEDGDRKCDHKNSISNGGDAISTKEPTHQHESHEQVVLDGVSTHDDIELEFERLAAEAVNDPVVVSPLPPPVPSQPPPISVQQEEKIVEEATIDSEPPQLPSSLPPPPPQTPISTEEKEEEEIDTRAEADKVVEEKEEEEKDQQPPTQQSTTADTSISSQTLYPGDLNPFGDDEVEEEEKENKHQTPPKKSTGESAAVRASLNPFGSCSEDEDGEASVNSYCNPNTGTLHKPLRPPRPPLPRAMTLKPASTNPFGSDDDDEEEERSRQMANKTPVPTPRKQLHSITPEPTPRYSSPGHSFKGSTSSLASSCDGNPMRRKKKKAPAPPLPRLATDEKQQQQTTPKKKRQAPTPPNLTPLKASDAINNAEDVRDQEISATDASLTVDSISDGGDQRRLIPLEESLIEEGASASLESAEEVTYRRKIVPLSPTSPEEENSSCESLKDHKEAENRHRQSRNSLKADSTDSLPYLNKSSHGQWKRRKGPAPALPGFALPQRRVLQMLPLQEIRHELEVIEVQQQGLEKQGVQLEKMIRERCEGDNRTAEELLESLPNAKNPKEVEELILQLFELVNEKNELFRRQAELMYLRRAHRLEEEQADVEYEIRTLMAQPEHNKTDSDKSREEALIARLVEIVQLRNEVVDCLEMDRLREAEEDLSIKQRMESHTAKLDQEYLNQTPTKLSKKEKKKLKEAKKLKNKKLNDADKDLDTSELKAESGEKKKKKKKFLF